MPEIQASQGFLAFENSNIKGLKQIKTGTTMEQLVAATSLLSENEYLTSILYMNGVYVLKPNVGISGSNLRYSLITMTSDNTLAITSYEYRQEASTYKKIDKTLSGAINEAAATITSWKLVYIKDVN